jgi:hypothetical protein
MPKVFSRLCFNARRLIMTQDSDNGHEDVVPIHDRHVVITPTGVTFVFNEEDQRRARECLERSGRITLNFAEVTVDSLTEVRSLDPDFLPMTPID